VVNLFCLFVPLPALKDPMPELRHLKEESGMSQKSSRGSTNQPSLPARKSPTRSTIQSVVVSQEEIERSILEVLKRHAAAKGLTNSELLKKCSSVIKKSLAALFKRKEVKTEDVKGMLYELWGKGLVFFEPPKRGQKVGRVWDMASASTVFCLARFPRAVETHPTETTEVGLEALKAAYEKFVPQHLGGFVPIFKVRRDLGWPTQVFDGLLHDLNERTDPVIELHAADPRDLTEEEKRDSLWQGGRLLVRMRWRAL
jgi:hypothetical protein